MAWPTLERFRSGRPARLVVLMVGGIVVTTNGHAQVSFAEHVLPSSGANPRLVLAVDLDGDGDTDIVSAISGISTINWWESDGGEPPTFVERIISTTADSPWGIFAADLNGDGHMDVVAATSDDDKIAWWESDGGLPPAFVERVISTAADEPRSVVASDVDGDGDMDVLSASLFDDTIAWYENLDGSGLEFFERIVSARADGADTVFAADVDGDGDIDVLSASQFDDKIAWYESNGGSPPLFVEREISTTADVANWVSAADLDRDGDTDVLSTSSHDDKIAWYENDGNMPPAFTERVISTTADNPIAALAVDVNGDGILDVVTASFYDDTIAWYESDGGSPPAFTQRIISTAADGVLSVFAADLDGDGDTDVLSASIVDNEIAWYENLGKKIPCGDIEKFQARCTLSGTVQVRVTMTDESHSGETVTIGLDGVPNVRTIFGMTASYQNRSAGFGGHTITLDDPPGCFAPVVKNCPASPQ